MKERLFELKRKDKSVLLTDPPVKIVISLRESEILAIRQIIKEENVKSPGIWAADLVRKELATRS